MEITFQQDLRLQLNALKAEQDQLRADVNRLQGENLQLQRALASANSTGSASVECGYNEGRWDQPGVIRYTEVVSPIELIGSSLTKECTLKELKF